MKIIILAFVLAATLYESEGKGSGLFRGKIVKLTCPPGYAWYGYMQQSQQRSVVSCCPKGKHMVPVGDAVVCCDPKDGLAHCMGTTCKCGGFAGIGGVMATKTKLPTYTKMSEVRYRKKDILAAAEAVKGLDI